ncbi:MAG: copper homeostasis protein CutC [Defluviitaleaceae bacterium]|nr:copper homeostasis protein CutC [Defluviitaleaceae bacterium]
MIEIIATTVKDARAIEAGGAGQIELVSALSEGGLTPSYGLIEAVVNAVKIPVNVMIRPHSASFIYDNDEIELMKKDIQIARELGAKGVVLGVLTEENEIDFEKLASLLAVCEGLDVTFHRAIDETDVVHSTKKLSTYQQITTILTSGGLTPVEENTMLIKEMIESSGHIDILVGGGVNFDNVKPILIQTGAQSAHLGSAVRVNDVVARCKVSELMQYLKSE